MIDLTNLSVWAALVPLPLSSLGLGTGSILVLLPGTGEAHPPDRHVVTIQLQHQRPLPGRKLGGNLKSVQRVCHPAGQFPVKLGGQVSTGRPE
ncbi:MAG: hypothetical protein ACK56I_23760, partial [bacterium]